jgi:hypothetical protein
VSITDVVFEESSAADPVRGLPLAHLSIELGHLYLEDLQAGPARIRELLRLVGPWAQAAREMCEAALGQRARISTCFLLDDYFTPEVPPSRVIPLVLEAATAAGVQIDYLARESGCATADGIPLARLVEDLLIDEPPQGATGGRPPVRESGWLCNGERSPVGGSPEATEEIGWRRPAESAAKLHSIFVDVELWDELPDGTRRWSCPMLAAVWQLLRLGVLRYRGEPVATPVPWSPPAQWAELSSWSQLPAIMQLTEQPAPFAAYRSYSVLPRRFMPTENAVRVILSQVSVERQVVDQLLARARSEQLVLPPETVGRIEYAFVGNRWQLDRPVR